MSVRTDDCDLVGLIRRLASVDSVNPALVPGAAGEQAVAGQVVDWAMACGLFVEVLDGTPGRPSVLVRSRPPGSGSGRSLMICGHLDTVGLGGMQEPLSARVEADRMLGRGVYDMKAGLAAALLACRDVARLGLDGELIVAAVADEEHASLGVQEVLSRVTTDAAIVTEPTELVVATAHGGFVWTEIRVLGKAAHGSRPQLGQDAILATGPILIALQDLNTRLRAAGHPLLGPGTLHASLISGGREESTIPAECVLTVERRTVPGETVQDVEREVAALLAECRTGDPRLRVTSRTTLARDPFEVSSDAAIVASVAAAAGRVLGQPARLGGLGYWADSAFLAAAGIPTVLFGPSGDGAHADDEWVDLPSVSACRRILTAAAVDFCR